MVAGLAAASANARPSLCGDRPGNDRQVIPKGKKLYFAATTMISTR